MNWIMGEMVRGAHIVKQYYCFKLNGLVVEMSNGRVFCHDYGVQYLLKEAPSGNPHTNESVRK